MGNELPCQQKMQFSKSEYAYQGNQQHIYTLSL